MARSSKLAELVVNETSGVDHPAHLHEGWLVIKSATTQGELENVELAVTEDQNQDDEIVAETPVAASVAGPDEELRKEMTDLRKELAAMRVEKERLEAEQENSAAVEKCAEWVAIPGVSEEFAPTLVALRKQAPAEALAVEAILDAAARSLSEAGVLKELGTSSDDATVGTDAWSQIETLANDMVASGEAPSFAKAVTLVATRDKDLYNTYLTEKGL
jgi:hypothetical protein